MSALFSLPRSDRAARLQDALLLFGLIAFAAGWLVSGHFPPWPAFQQQSLAAFGLAWVVLAASVGRPIWVWPRPSIAALALACTPLLQGLLGPIVFITDAVLPATYLLGFALCIAASANLVEQHRERCAEWLMSALLAAAILSTGFALAQWLRVQIPGISIDPLAIGGRPYANLSQPNHLTTLLGLGLSGLLLLYERARVGSFAAALVAAWLGVGLLMTQSRSGWVFLALLGSWWYLRRDRLRLGGLALLTGLAAFTVGVLAWDSINAVVLGDLPAESLNARLSSGTRPANWAALIEAIGRAPWLGWGWNQVSVAYLAIAYERPISPEVVLNAHNIVLDLMIWIGLPAATVVVLLAARWLAWQVRMCRDGTRWSLLLAVAAIGVHAMTEYPLDFSYFLLTLGLLVGALDATAEEKTAAPKASRATFLVPWALGVLMLVWICNEYVRVEESARQARFALAGVGKDRTTPVPLPEVVLLDALREYQRYWATPARRGMPAEELEWMRDVTQRHPFQPALLRYALAAGLNDRPQESARALRAICHTHPPARCDDVRRTWALLREQHPELPAIPSAIAGSSSW